MNEAAPKLPPPIPPVASGAPATSPGKALDAKTAASLASGNPPGPSAPVAAAVPAATSVPLFGGFRGGRKRKDGLRPGSPEALAEDRRKDNERKIRTRAAALAAATPSPLPAALPGATVPMAGSVSEKTLPPDHGVVPVQTFESPGLALAWKAGDLLPVTKAGVPLLEQVLGRQIIHKAKRARLPAEIISEIEEDAKWPAASRQMLIETSDALAAKYLNKAGISAEYKIEVNFSIAVLNIGANHMAILRRLDKLIAAANAGAPGTAPAPEKKI